MPALVQRLGLDEARFTIVGVEFSKKLLDGKDGLKILVVDREHLAGMEMSEFADANEYLPITDIEVHDTPAIDLLSDELVRLKVQLVSCSVPDGATLRRVARGDIKGAL